MSEYAPCTSSKTIVSRVCFRLAPLFMVTAPAAWAVLCTHPAARGARECTHDRRHSNHQRLSKTHCVLCAARRRRHARRVVKKACWSFLISDYDQKRELTLAKNWHAKLASSCAPVLATPTRKKCSVLVTKTSLAPQAWTRSSRTRQWTYRLSPTSVPLPLPGSLMLR